MGLRRASQAGGEEPAEKLVGGERTKQRPRATFISPWQVCGNGRLEPEKEPMRSESLSMARGVSGCQWSFQLLTLLHGGGRRERIRGAAIYSANSLLSWRKWLNDARQE